MTDRLLLRWLIAPHRRQIWKMLLASCGLVAVEGLMAIPLLMLANRLNVDEAIALPANLAFFIPDQIDNPLWPWILFFAAAILRSAVLVGQSWTAIGLRVAVEKRLYQSIFDKLHTLTLDTLQRQHSAQWISLLNPYTHHIGQLTDSFSKGVTAVVILLAYLVPALLISPLFTAGACILGIVVNLGIRPFYLRRVQAANRKRIQELTHLHQTIQENMGGIKQTYLFQRQEWITGIFARTVDRYQNNAQKTYLMTSLNFPLTILLNLAALIILLSFGLTLLPGNLSARLTQLALFLLIGLRLMKPVADLSQAQSQWLQGRTQVAKAQSFLDNKTLPTEPKGGEKFTRLKEGIEINNLSFCYPHEENSVLQQVSLKIPKGKITAVVGVSGSGKSTLVNLLLHLYEINSGEILVDGQNLMKIEIDSWRNQLAVVSQDVFLFHASVIENLRFARPQATDEEVMQAAQLAQAHDFITALPHGYDTAVLERGVRLSGGQRQRLALARAILRSPDLLILDEATSELDSQTEQAIQNALIAYGRERTMLIIAHRLATIAEADHVYVFDRGRIVEQGTPDSLSRNRGLFQTLREAQRR